MLTIGQVAKAANVNVETVRYYQRRGLLREPEKPVSGQRKYSVDDVHRLSFIKRAQVLGFTLEEIGNLLQLEGADCCGDTHDLAVRKLTLIDAKIADLTSMRKALADLVLQCELGNQQGSCPIIQSLLPG
ncbi:MAG: Hg(II)-responsive transcriptional regulator [Ralstonia sp.]|jgi:MerR family mercuric resistance operon transcriptional regulator|uniref:Mercuric resistance operon regulatory protein n=2 Tax=Ralstonia TaxID=48736 RepID=A0ABN9IVA9_9RALS|nr:MULTISPECIES: Hg(II)-responsive transcriptional regulator [Ralstonia]MDF6804853.1 Hg(II)-responsive transcriptional regulator [Escherichia coli]MBA9845256.1 Hg(II)-responsive transcriptional regulator [Ralstonia pickettii]MBA9852352.1 Hg(II)-responsive transcriptional regulator [Ralstonia pickettii]MBA9878676.1 Hg(II)-responsive transcriptional regulator [Ralstonia pickettii]MBA9881909.1 Hg(II)-responsive transcriptional regulator [Ralstonia pickettii]